MSDRHLGQNTPAIAATEFAIVIVGGMWAQDVGAMVGVSRRAAAVAARTVDAVWCCRHLPTLWSLAGVIDCNLLLNV